jgi:diaminopimelate decarboxylase
MTAPEQHATPLLPEATLRAFVSEWFDRRDTLLCALESHASPLYLLDGAALREKAGRFKEAFSRVVPDAGFYFAVKSNNHPEVSRILLECGFGLDVSSGVELEGALALGASDIVLSGPGKTDPELTLAAGHNDRVAVLMDSFGELDRLGRIADNLGQDVRAGVRLTTNPTGFWRKFGILPEALGSFMEAARKWKYISLEGLQFHTSWNLTPAAQIDFVRHLGGILGGLPPGLGESIRFIDMGGGYWPPGGEWLQAAATPEGIRSAAAGNPVIAPTTHYYQAASPISEFAETMGEAVRNHIFPHNRCRICFEPGRWVSHEAMHLLLTVVDKKAPDLAITDAGTNTVGWERFESDYFPVLNLTRPAMTEHPCHILGSLCTPHDVWGYAYWGENIEVGDVLLIPTQGAYTYSLRQHFIKALPEVVML